jgi:glutathione synthase/RimK-type ligase-like ATP-grasp enzyme
VSVLLVTESHDLAADLIVLELKRRGTHYWRLNLDTFPEAVQIAYDCETSTAVFQTAAATFSSGEVRVAWCRRPPRPVCHDSYVDQETRTFLDNLWEEMHWQWLSSPSSITSAENKLRQLRVARDLGLDVPETLAGNRIESVFERLDTGPIVVKTIGGAGIERDGRQESLYSQILSLTTADSAAVKAAPCIFQEPAKPGTDVRAVVAGARVFAADIVAPAEFLDWRAAPPDAVSYGTTHLPGDVTSRCLEFCRIVGIGYAAFDFVRQPDGRYVFLEANPGGQWGWIEHATRQPIASAIADALLKLGGLTDVA